ncbi:hypothetical protein [Streptomyces sp. NPDC001948]
MAKRTKKSISPDDPDAGTSPLIERFTAWLRIYYLDVSEEQADAHWSTMLARSPELAAEELQCIRKVAADPPPNLVPIIEQYASMYWWKKHRRIPWTHDDYVAWLRSRVNKFSDAAKKHGLRELTPVRTEDGPR